VSYSAFSALGITRIFNGGAIDRTELIADGCRRFAVYVIVSLVFVWAMAQDHRLLRRTPFPILSFSSLRWNWLGALAMICPNLFLSTAIWRKFADDIKAGMLDEPALMVSSSLHAAGSLLFTAITAFDILAVVWYAIHYHRHYVPVSKSIFKADLNFSLSPATFDANAMTGAARSTDSGLSLPTLRLITKPVLDQCT